MVYCNSKAAWLQWNLLKSSKWKKRLDFKQVIPVSWLFPEVYAASHRPGVQRAAVTHLSTCFSIVAWMDVLTWLRSTVPCHWLSKASALPAKGAVCLLLSFPILLTGQILQAELPQSNVQVLSLWTHREYWHQEGFVQGTCSYKTAFLFSSLASLA